jgi:hypothetical protein
VIPAAADLAPVPCRPRHDPTLLARRVTCDNIPHIAGWAGAIADVRHQQVRLRPSPLDHPGARGYTADIGDWVVRAPTGHYFKVSDRAFHDLYEITEGSA